MKEQAERAIARARQTLSKSWILFELKMFDIAGRQAYIASLTAARAFIFERTGQATKTHKGVKGVMHDMARAGLPVERDLLVILDYGFDLKTTADYGDSETISESEAQKALELAERFVARIENLIASD